MNINTNQYSEINKVLLKIINESYNKTILQSTSRTIIRASTVIVRNMTIKLKSDEQHHVEVEDPYFKN